MRGIATVPEAWKHPLGPYRQAPPEFGGEWWLVSPFLGETPWERFQTPVTEPDLPEGFLEIFGPRPEVRNGLEDRAAAVRWEQELRWFKRAAEFPADEDGELLDRGLIGHANAAYEAWAMGRMYFYEGRYGWRAAFPESQIPDFDVDAKGAVESAHLVIARYQIKLASLGYEPERRHPFVPPHVWGDEDGAQP